jgi:phosphoglycerate kinase
MADKKSVESLTKEQLAGKRVLVRADLNVPLSKSGTVEDDTRIKEAIPTLKYLLENDAQVLLCSHLGRPKKGPEPQFSLKALVPSLESYLKTKVVFASDCIGEEVQKALSGLKNGEVLLLENTRFHKEEEKNDPEFAKQLAAPADVYVNDAFGSAHRAHASTEGVTHYLSPNVAGFLMKKELKFLDGVIKDPQRPLIAIVGGSKVSSKITVLESLIQKVDKLILGGGMIFTFFKAEGISVGKSLVEEDQLELAKKVKAAATAKGVEFLLPVDVVLADNFAEDAKTQVTDINSIPDGWMGLDIGPKSVKEFQAALQGAKSVVWNGPMGVFEMKPFAAGTNGIAHTLADLTAEGATTVIGGGDSVSAVNQAGLSDKMSHISTGGGASLELLEGKVLPGVAALDSK